MRFDNINLLRAFAALAVVVYHVIEHLKWSAFPITGPLLTFRIGWVGVDLFFVISGFVIVHSALILYRRSPPTFSYQYWFRRLTRILPLYLLTLALWIAFISDSFFSQPAKAWGWQLITHLSFTHSFWIETHGSIDGVNWTLALEMQFYLAVALLIRWIDRTPGWRIWLWCTLIAWAWRTCMMVLYGHGETFPLFVHVTQLPGTLDEFGAGIFLAKWLHDNPAKRPGGGPLWLLLACGTGYVTMSVFWGNGEYWNNSFMVIFWRTLLALFLFSVLAAAVHLPQFAARRLMHPFNHLGEVSYGIYLWHIFAIQFANRIHGLTPLQGLVIVLAMTILASIVSWHYLERPMMSLARKE